MASPDRAPVTKIFRIAIDRLDGMYLAVLYDNIYYADENATTLRPVEGSSIYSGACRVQLRKRDETVRVVTVYHNSVVGTYPEIAFTVFLHHIDEVRLGAEVLPVIYLYPGAVVSVQALVGTYPDKTARILVQFSHSVVRQRTVVAVHAGKLKFYCSGRSGNYQKQGYEQGTEHHLAKNLNCVVERNVCPGRSSVEGKRS